MLKSDGVWADTVKAPDIETLYAAAAHVKLGASANVAIINVVPNSVIMAPVWAIAYSALLAGLAPALGAIILAIVLSRSLTRPLRLTTAAVQAFGRNEPIRLRSMPLARSACWCGHSSNC